VHDGVLSVDDISDYSKFLDEICECCEANAIALEAISSESGMSQFEINLQHTEDVLKLADGLVFLKNIIRLIARKNGFAATFMAKPFASRPGNGIHAHYSLLNENKLNVFDNGTETGSDNMLSSVGGLLAHMRQSALIFAPHLNSFRRLSPKQHAPLNFTWGYENRTAAIRIPGGKHSSRRIEHRVAGADTNIYLVLATILGAALDGLKRQTRPPQPVSGDCSHSGIGQEDALPATWFEAISSFEHGDLIGGALNSVIHDMMIRTKRQELLTFTHDVSKFEYETYLETV
jgi:glutamine synthetase